jgi:hypothetical protein
MSNNELKITLNISDELLAKLVMAMKQSPNPLNGIPPQILASLMGGAMVAPPKAPSKDKATVGFKAKS